MTLRRKMTLQISAMISGLLLVSAASIWGVRGLRGDFGIAASGYRELREIYEVAAHVNSARTLLGVNARDAAALEIDRASAKLDLVISREASGSALRQSPDAAGRVAAFRTAIHHAAAQLRLPEEEAFHSGTDSANAAVNSALGAAAAVALSIRQTINDHERAADLRWHETLTLVAVFCIVIVLAAGVLGMMQYRSAITPLRRLATAARAMAGGRFDALVPVSGDAEFADLAADFNRMATELRTLYQDLERKVAAQSRELVRSERLASVGYLAAGVAHEINNPLSIITGYGERAIQQLERGGESEITVKHLRIMCEEAYRCKAITDKLLSLARPGEEKRTSVELSKLAREVIALAEGLPDHAGQTITLEAGGDAMVLASADELKQVLLNLILNAFDASEGFSGHVAVRVEGSNGTAALSVTDQGRGMDAQTIERVFEPFFTDKRGSQQAGTGLGLSISHAIIMSHGGRLTAASDGPGCGSRFTIELPVST